jgi:hypothetical protein
MVSEPLQEVPQDQPANENDIAAEEPELIPFEPIELPSQAYELPDETAPIDSNEIDISDGSADSTAHDVKEHAEPEPLAATPEPIAVDEHMYEPTLNEQIHVNEESSSLVSDEIEPVCPYAFAEDEDYEFGLESAGSLELLHGPFTTYLESQSTDDTDEEADEPAEEVSWDFDHREDQPTSSNSRKASELARKILGRNAFALAA